MSLVLKPLGNIFAAEVVNLDLRQGIDPQIAEDIEVALATHAVLCFRNQPLNDDQQQAFIQMFGPPHVTNLKELSSGLRHHPHFYDIATVDEDGKPIPDHSPRGLYLLANQLWHTDGSQNQLPMRISALSARLLPPNPPDTEYADMRAAWEALPETRKRELEGLMVEHSMLTSRSKIGMKASDFSEDSLRSRQPVVHPLVRTHPRLGRKSLYLASHASHIVGWPEEKGRQLLDELTHFATQSEFVYAHKWQPCDLVMWDDSCTMHRATPYTGPHPRRMRWCGVRELAPV